MNRPRLSAVCRNCRRERPADELDDQRWCNECRQRVVQRASRWGRGLALLLTLALGVWIAAAIQPSTRFLVGWMAILALAYAVLLRIVRRVAFEVIRARSIPSGGP